MTEKRFTTVELPKPNRWGIWYDGAYLSTYQVCILLNEYVDVKKENEQLKQQLKTKYIVNKQYEELQRLKEENEQFKKALIELKEIGDYQYTRIKELSDENEQLKHRIKKLQNELNNCEEDYILEEYL